MGLTGSSWEIFVSDFVPRGCHSHCMRSVLNLTMNKSLLRNANRQVPSQRRQAQQPQPSTAGPYSRSTLAQYPLPYPHSMLHTRPCSPCTLSGTPKTLTCVNSVSWWVRQTKMPLTWRPSSCLIISIQVPPMAHSRPPLPPLPPSISAHWP